VSLRGIALFFGLGLLLAFTPCSLPMLPILWPGWWVGSGAGRQGAALMLGVGFMVLMHGRWCMQPALGVLGRPSGGNLQAGCNSHGLLGHLPACLLLLALPMFGVFELPIASLCQDRLDQADASKPVGTGRRGGAGACCQACWSGPAMDCASGRRTAASHRPGPATCCRAPGPVCISIAWAYLLYCWSTVGTRFLAAPPAPG